MAFFVFSGLLPKMINARSKNLNLVYPTSPALPPPPIDFLANCMVGLVVGSGREWKWFCTMRLRYLTLKIITSKSLFDIGCKTQQYRCRWYIYKRCLRQFEYPLTSDTRSTSIRVRSSDRDESHAWLAEHGDCCQGPYNPCVTDKRRIKEDDDQGVPADYITVAVDVT